MSRLSRARVWLLDANLLIALTYAAHVHHSRGLVSFASAGGLAGHAELVSARVTVQEPGAKYTAPRVKRGAR